MLAKPLYKKNNFERILKTGFWSGRAVLKNQNLEDF
jgi:hypothetical protein